MARHGLAADASALRDLAPGRRLATLIATVRSLTFQAADDVGDALHALVAERIIRRATREAVPAQRRSFGRLSDVSLEPAAAFDVVLEALADESLTDESFRRRLRDGLDVAAITRTLGVVRAVAAPDGDDDSVAAEMLRRFLTVRAFAPLVAERLPLGATTGGAPILAALRSLPRLLTAGRVTPADIDPDVLSGSWHRLVFANHGVDERAYAVAVTEALHRAMRRRDVFVVDGRRWGDPRARLLDDDAWSHVKGDVLTGLELPGEPGGHLDRLVERLDTAYRTVADELGDNTAVRVGDDGKVHLSPGDPLGTPPALQALRTATAAMLPRVDLPDVLMEVHDWTGFLDEFTHASESAARMDRRELSIAAVLIAQACNVGLTPVENETDEALTRKRLSHIEQSYLRADTLRAANGRLVDAQHGIALAEHWGGGHCASADGMRFVVRVASVTSAPNPRYFGRRKGLTWLNYLNDRVAGLSAVVIPGTIRDSLYILDGLLDIDLHHRPDMIATDTASYSDQVFGLFALLGYRFSPRLADLPDQASGPPARPTTTGHSPPPHATSSTSTSSPRTGTTCSASPDRSSPHGSAPPISYE